MTTGQGGVTSERLLETFWLGSEDGEQFVTSYRALQIFIGLLALTLTPIVVFIDEVFGDDVFHGSLSHYYYGPGRNWFVGALFAMGLFLVTYQIKPRKGYGIDNALSIVGGIACATVALAPTPENESDRALNVHNVSAGILFVILAIFCLFLFTKSAPGKPLTDAKRRRNTIYRACGLTIVAALVVLVWARSSGWDLVFLWSEIVAVTAFAIGWLVKGRFFGFLNNPEPGNDPEPDVEVVDPHAAHAADAAYADDAADVTLTESQPIH